MALRWQYPERDEFQVDGCPKCDSKQIGWDRNWNISGQPAIRCLDCHHFGAPGSFITMLDEEDS